MWYNEIKDYDFNNPTFSSQCGHFTQVVWADSTLLGGGIATTTDGKTFVVARYSKPGNMRSKFKENVKPLQEDSVISRDSRTPSVKKQKVNLDEENRKENMKDNSGIKNISTN